MSTPRRIAALLLTAALSFGIIGIGTGPAEAMKDTTWPVPGVSDSSSHSLTDTTWPW